MICLNKLFNYNLIEKIKKYYDYIFLEINNKKLYNKKTIINSDEKIFLIRPNLFGIKNAKNIIEKNNLKNIKIIINNYNIYSIDEKIISNIFYNSKIIGKIKYKKEYDELINNNFKSNLLKNKNYKKEMECLINNII